MSWIEGIGDEVTIGVSIVLGVCILFIAWLSTGIRDIPFISVIVVQLTRRRAVQAENSNTSSSAENAASENIPEGDTGESHDRREVTPSDSETLVETAGSSSSQKNSTTNVEKKEETSSTSETCTAVTGTNSKSDENETNDVENSSDPCQSSGQSNDSSHESSAINKSNTEQKSDDTNATANIPDSEPEICTVSNTELRQRRLEFFSGQSSENVQCDSQSVNQCEDRDRGSDRINSETEPCPELRPKPLSKLASDLLSSTDSTGVDSVNANIDVSEQAEAQSETGSGSQDSGLEPGMIRVKIKFLNDTQRLVTALATETIGNFRRRHFSTELSESKLVRFIFNGKEMRNDSSTLQSHNICDNSVLHCLVTQQPQEQHQDHHGDEDGLDIGIFMFPLFGLLLGIVWYMRFMYRQFFNVTSTLTLGGITFLYLAAFMSSLRGQRNHEHID